MGMYELVNPSDPYTYHAADDGVAVFIALMLGEGFYAAKRLSDGANLGGIGLGMDEARTQAAIREWLGTDLETFAHSREKDITEAMETVLIGTIAQREQLEANLSEMNQEQRGAAVAAYKQQLRTSTNDIQANADDLALRMRRGWLTCANQGN